MVDIETGGSLVPMVGDEDFSPVFKKSAERVSKRVGMLANNVRAMANAPELGATMRHFLDDVWDHADLPKPMKALIRQKVSNINACLYCSAHQLKVLASQGVEQDKIDNMYDYLTHPAFSDKERAILAYAEALTMDAGSISQDVIRAFTAHTTDQERVEVTNVAAAMGLLNRLNDGLRVQLEEPIVFIPGLVGLYDAWSFQLEHFSKRYRCVTFDHRGTGESDKPTRRGAYSTQAIAEDVIGLMDTLGIERAHIVGTSTSGCILQNLALDYPDRVCACIFNNPWVTADQFITRVAITRKRIAETYGPEEYVKVPIVVIPRSGIRRCKPSLKRLIS